MKYRPHQNYLLVEKVVPSTVGGLHLPTSVQESPDWVDWIVRAKGEEARENIEVGMSVVIPHGNLIPIGNDDSYYLVADELVVAEKV